MILKQMSQVNESFERMKVELGNELVYRIDPEYGDNVKVIRWKQMQWFTYPLDTQAVNIFKHSDISESVVVMKVTAPYLHPFMFISDFRQHLLNQVRDVTMNTSCQLDMVAAPDMFSLVIDKSTEVLNVLKFYAPVLESLHGKKMSLLIV